MLWTIIGLLIIFWLLGFSFEIAGGLVHILLVIALILLIFRLVTGRKITLHETKATANLYAIAFVLTYIGTS